MRTPIALISVSDAGARAAARLSERLPVARAFLHESASASFAGERYSSLVDLTSRLFSEFGSLVYSAPCGAVVRAVAPLLQNKKTDPAVVVVDAGGRYAISLLSGHEGGGNALAVLAANALGGEPVITTASEAVKTVIAGIGCRRGVECARVLEALHQALEKAGVSIREVRLLASADIKAGEAGLLQASARLGIPIRFIPSEEIRACPMAFSRSEFVEEKVNLPAVAEPAALLGGRRTRLLLPRILCNGITVALAREGCW
ncbi:MAG: cobalamin biosynthesis protein [Planctomycetes bacterium]|nr:cobalamin biosynthesis protein [Planctomycetota bacterium]